MSAGLPIPAGRACFNQIVDAFPWRALQGLGTPGMRQIRSTRVVPPQSPVPCGGRPLFFKTSAFAVDIATWRDQQAPRWLGDGCAVVPFPDRTLMRTGDPLKPRTGQTCSCEVSDIRPLRARALLSADLGAWTALVASSPRRATAETPYPRNSGPPFGGPRLPRPNEGRSLAQPASASSRGCRSLRSASARTFVSSYPAVSGPRISPRSAPSRSLDRNAWRFRTACRRRGAGPSPPRRPRTNSAWPGFRTFGVAHTRRP